MAVYNYKSLSIRAMQYAKTISGIVPETVYAFGRGQSPYLTEQDSENIQLSLFFSTRLAKDVYQVGYKYQIGYKYKNLYKNMLQPPLANNKKIFRNIQNV